MKKKVSLTNKLKRTKYRYKLQHVNQTNESGGI